MGVGNFLLKVGLRTLRRIGAAYARRLRGTLNKVKSRAMSSE